MGRVYEGVGKAWVAYNEGSSTRPRKTGKRVSFHGSELYSYTTAVARYRDGVDGSRYVVATNRKYSVSTSSHISNCVRECNAPVFYTYDIWASEEVVLAGLVSNYDNAVRSALRCWKNEWRDWSYWVCAAHKEVVQFCGLTGLEFPLRPINEVTAEIFKQRDEKMEAFHDPKAVARRERAAARREAKMALQIAA